MSTTRKYRDLSMLFDPHPVTGDVVTKTDSTAIKQSIRNLVLSMNYDYPFHPEKGCQIYNLLFDNVDSITLQIIRKSVIDVLNSYEPRVSIVDVIVEDLSTQNAVNVKVMYMIISSNVMEEVSVFVDRLR